MSGIENDLPSRTRALEARPGPDWGRWALPLSLVALCGVLYLWRLGLTPLEDFDEAYYAVGAKEMLARGDLGTPFYNAQPFLLKPILIYWLIAGAFRLLGPGEFAARVGSAFLGAGLVLLTYWFGARTLSRRAGYFAGVALALNYMWVDIARDASIDIPLTAALVPAMFLFFLAPHARPERRRWLYLAAYPLVGVALLAKGPVPTGVVGVGLLAYLIASRRVWSTLREAQVLPGLVLLLAVAAPWYIYELRAQPAFYQTFFIGEHFGHIGGKLARNEPVWGNLKYLLIYFLPWAAFLPAAVAHTLRERDRGGVLHFAAWWSLAVVVLFSIPKSKLAHYLAPAFPPLALLVGAWLDAWLAGRTRERASAAFARLLLAVIGVGAAVAAGLVIAPPPFLQARLATIPGRFDGWTPGPWPIVILAVIGIGFLAAAICAGGRRAMVAPALAGTMLAASLMHVGWFRPHLALIQAQPRKELAQYAASALPPSMPFGVYYAKRNSTIFYFGRPLVDLGEWEPQRLADFLRQREPVAALTHEKLLRQLDSMGVTYAVQQRRGAYVLLTNQSSAK